MGGKTCDACFPKTRGCVPPRDERGLPGQRLAAMRPTEALYLGGVMPHLVEPLRREDPEPEGLSCLLAGKRPASTLGYLLVGLDRGTNVWKLHRYKR